MMNSSPEDTRNDNPNDSGSHRSFAHGSESLDRKISSAKRSNDIRPNDVLCGRSKSSFNHGKLASTNGCRSDEVLLLTCIGCSGKPALSQYCNGSSSGIQPS